MPTSQRQLDPRRGGGRDEDLRLLSVSALLGVGLFALIGAAWLDPVAGFVIAAFAIYEGREAWEGELVEDDD